MSVIIRKINRVQKTFKAVVFALNLLLSLGHINCQQEDQREISAGFKAREKRKAGKFCLSVDYSIDLMKKKSLEFFFSSIFSFLLHFRIRKTFSLAKFCTELPVRRCCHWCRSQSKSGHLRSMRQKMPPKPLSHLLRVLSCLW